MDLILTQTNYHSNKANQVYMSHSQYQDFISCEAMALAKLNGEWQEEESDAMLLGSYVHAWNEGVLEQFKADHPELISSKGPTKGELKAEFRIADRMIQTLEKDPFCMFALQGQKEVIITAEFAGAVWRAKLDVYNPEFSRIADLKTVGNIRQKHWDKQYGAYVSFVEAFRYITQLSVYVELERIWSGRDQWLEPLIVAVSKETIPDKEIIGFDAQRIQYELELVAEKMPRVLAVKNKLEEPVRCERCEYCRSTKQIGRIVHYMDLLA